MDVKSTWIPTGIEWIIFYGHLDFFSKPPLGGRPNTKPGDHGTSNAHNRWFSLFYHVWGSAWIEIHWNSIWLRAPSRMTSHYTWGSMTTLHDYGSDLDALWTLSFGLSQFHGHALGLCVKWPWVPLKTSEPTIVISILDSIINIIGGTYMIIERARTSSHW
jgi:hypothetical protein